MKKSIDPKLIIIGIVALVAVGAGVYVLAPGEEGGKELQTAGTKPKDLEENPNTPAGMGLDSGTPSGEAAGAADPNAGAGGEGQSAAAR